MGFFVNDYSRWFLKKFISLAVSDVSLVSSASHEISGIENDHNAIGSAY